MTTIHPFPELRALAEVEARAFNGASDTWTEEGLEREAIPAMLALLCDLTRPASRDAVCRLVGARIGWPAWQVAKAEYDWVAFVSMMRAAGMPDLERWDSHPPFPPTLAAIVRHLWPESP